MTRPRSPIATHFAKSREDSRNPPLAADRTNAVPRPEGVHHEKDFLIVVVLVLLIVGLTLLPGKVSSHREAPLISQDPMADNTDLYAFRSPELTDTVTINCKLHPVPLGKSAKTQDRRTCPVCMERKRFPASMKIGAYA